MEIMFKFAMSGILDTYNSVYLSLMLSLYLYLTLSLTLFKTFSPVVEPGHLQLLLEPPRKACQWSPQFQVS